MLWHSVLLSRVIRKLWKSKKYLTAEIIDFLTLNKDKVMYWQSSVPSIHFSSSHSCQRITFLVLSKLQLTMQITHRLKTREKIIIFLSSGFSQLGDFSSCQETLAILPSMPKRHLETKHHVWKWLDHWAWTKVGCQKFLCLTVQSKEELRTCHMTDTGVLSILPLPFGVNGAN